MRHDALELRAQRPLVTLGQALQLLDQVGHVQAGRLTRPQDKNLLLDPGCEIPIIQRAGWWHPRHIVGLARHDFRLPQGIKTPFTIIGPRGTNPKGKGFVLPRAVNFVSGMQSSGERSTRSLTSQNHHQTSSPLFSASKVLAGR
jgi:hypothetical protein